MNIKPFQIYPYFGFPSLVSDNPELMTRIEKKTQPMNKRWMLAYDADYVNDDNLRIAYNLPSRARSSRRKKSPKKKLRSGLLTCVKSPSVTDRRVTHVRSLKPRQNLRAIRVNNATFVKR
mgnify:CR=1 FL=1